MSKSSAGKLASQSSIVSYNFPLQARPVFLVPGQAVPKHFCPTLVVADLRTNCLQHININLIQLSKKIIYLSQVLHFSVYMFPCSSAIYSLEIPDLRCKPSIF